EYISPTFCALRRVELRPARTLLVTNFVINPGGQREASYLSLPVKPSNLMPDRNVSLHLAPLSLPGLGIRRVGHQLKTPPLPTSELVQEPGVVRRLRRTRVPPGLFHQNRARRLFWSHHIKHVLKIGRAHV